MATPTTAGYGNISTNSTTQVSLPLSLSLSLSLKRLFLSKDQKQN